MSRLSLLCLNLRVKSKDKDTFGQCLHCPYLSGVWGVLSAQENQGRFRRVWCALVARAFRACTRIQNGSWDIFPNTRFNATLEARGSYRSCARRCASHCGSWKQTDHGVDLATGAKVSLRRPPPLLTLLPMIGPQQKPTVDQGSHGVVSVQIEAVFALGQQNFLPEGFSFEDDFFRCASRPVF